MSETPQEREERMQREFIESIRKRPAPEWMREEEENMNTYQVALENDGISLSDLIKLLGKVRAQLVSVEFRIKVEADSVLEAAAKARNLADGLWVDDVQRVGADFKEALRESYTSPVLNGIVEPPSKNESAEEASNA